MSSGRKKILWLVSWYPNRLDKYDGDFIQRHARAAAQMHDIHVIFLKEAKIVQEKEEEWAEVEGLTEQIIYYKKRDEWLGKVKNQLTWYRLFLEAVDAYIRKKGMPYLVHVHVPWKAGLIALQLKRRSGLKYIVTEHWGMYNDVLEDRYSNKPFFVRTLLKQVYKYAEHLVTPSRYLAEAINNRVTSKAYTVIPNVVDTSLFLKDGKKHAVFTFLHVSNMVPLKNVPGILKAFHTLVEERGIQNVQLLLVGNRDNEYFELARQLGLLHSRVFFKGEISYADVAREMQAAHCLVLNSRMENSPCVIGEALCAGLPVIAPKVGGIPELVAETNSVLVEPNDVQGLSEAMAHVYYHYNSFNSNIIAEEAARQFGPTTISVLHDELYSRF